MQNVLFTIYNSQSNIWVGVSFLLTIALDFSFDVNEIKFPSQAGRLPYVFYLSYHHIQPITIIADTVTPLGLKSTNVPGARKTL